MANVEAVKLKKGDYILFHNEVAKILKTEFYNPGKGSAVVRVRIQNMLSGKAVDFTYKSSELVETADVQGSQMQYLYKDSEGYHFMDTTTYDQYILEEDILNESGKYLKDGDSYYVYMYNDKPIGLNFGGSVTLTVTRAEEAVQGNTSTSITKEVTLETGAIVRVPPFIKVGDKVSINPDTGEYRGRVND